MNKSQPALGSVQITLMGALLIAGFVILLIGHAAWPVWAWATLTALAIIVSAHGGNSSPHRKAGKFFSPALAGALLAANFAILIITRAPWPVFALAAVTSLPVVIGEYGRIQWRTQS